MCTKAHVTTLCHCPFLKMALLLLQSSCVTGELLTSQMAVRRLGDVSACIAYVPMVVATMHVDARRWRSWCAARA